MSDNEPGITRRKLYDMVWKEPVEDVAARFGLSGRGFAKLCERHSIPVPPRGYWQRKAAGRIKEPRPPLIELPGEAVGRLDLHIKAAIDNSALQRSRRGDEEIHPEFKRIFQSELAAKRTVKMPAGLADLHPLVAQWIKEEGRTPSALTRTEPLQARIYRTCSALLKACGAMGFQPSKGEQRHSSCRVRFRSTELSFGIVEHVRHSRREITAEERREAPWLISKFRQIQEPTGKPVLTLHLLNGPSLPKGIPTVWLDSEDAQLESKLPEVLAAMVAGTAFGEHCAAVEQERLLEEERRRQAAEERRRGREREAQRKAALQADAEAWRQAMNLRAYIAAVKAEIEAGHAVDLPFAAEDWVAWSSAVADEIDPLRRRTG